MANDLSKLVVGDTTYDIKDATAARRNIYYGTCTTAANTYKKVATVETFPLDSDNKPLVGTIVAIKYSYTNTYKTEGQTYQLNVNSTGDYPMYYNNAALATSTSANTLVAGYKNRHIFYMFDGSQWVWVTSSYDANTTYSGMTQAEVDAGTGTTARLITPQRLRDNFYTETEVNNLLSAKANSADLAPVATSGSYNDLTNKPTLLTTQKTILYASGTTQNLSFTNSSNASLVRDQVVDLFNNVGNDILLFLTNPIDSVTYPYIFTEKVSDTRWKLQLLSDTKYGHVTLDSGRGNNIVAWENVLNTIPTVDSSLTGSSQTNPVQGSAIYSALADKMQRVVINMEENNGVLTFTDVDDNALTHAQVRATLNNVANDIIINYQGDYYSKKSADEDWWSLENSSLTIYNYIDLAWEEDNIIIDYIGASDLNYEFVKQTRKVNNKPLSTDITLTASDVGALPNTTTIPTKVSDLTNDSGFITGYTETDPVFAASAAHGISSADISSWNAKADPVAIVTVSTTGAVTQALDPNKFYNFTGSPTSLTLTLTSGTGLCIYAGKFTAGTGFSNLSFPASVKVADGAPSVEAGGVYEFSVMDNLLLLAKEDE